MSLTKRLGIIIGTELALIILIGIISFIHTTRVEVRVDGTFSVEPLSYRRIDYMTEQGKLKGWFSSDIPVSVYINPAIPFRYPPVVYTWGVEKATRSSFNIPAASPLYIYNPNPMNSASVKVYVEEQIVEYPYVQLGNITLFPLIVLLVLTLIIGNILMRKKQSTL